MTKSRIPELDIMKGIAILCVILEHINSNPDVVKNLITSFHMPLFFILAGYFYKPDNHYLAKLRKDFKRLIVPYIATMSILAIYSFIIHFALSSDHTKAYLTFWACLYPSGIKGCTMVNIVPVWFLCALFWCREIYNFIFVKITQTKAILLIVIICASATFLYENTSIEMPFSFMQGLSAMMFYLIGWAIHRLLNNHKLNNYHLILASVIWLIGFRYCNTEMINCSYTDYPLAIIVATCGTLSIYGVAKLMVIYFTPHYK